MHHFRHDLATNLAVLLEAPIATFDAESHRASVEADWKPNIAKKTAHNHREEGTGEYDNREQLHTMTE